MANPQHLCGVHPAACHGIHANRLTLNPSESLAAVQRLASDMRQPFVIGERDLRCRLLEAGYLIFDKRAKNEKKNRNTLTIRKRHWAGRTSVLHLNATRVLGLDDDEARPSTSGGA